MGSIRVYLSCLELQLLCVPDSLVFWEECVDDSVPEGVDAELGQGEQVLPLQEPVLVEVELVKPADRHR